MGGIWKKFGISDIEIVCVGRLLFEWCVCCWFDDELCIDFCYELEVVDFVFDCVNNVIVGVVVDNGDVDGGDGL